MGRLAFEHAVRERLQGKRHLQPVFSTGLYNVPHALRQYDKNLFVVWNRKRQRYEIHSLGHIHNTYACDVPNNRLDSRAEEAIRRGDMRIHGRRVLDEIDEHNERLERNLERRRRNDLMGISEEMYPYFRRLGWEGY
jgi:hypothetical protein